MNESQSRWRLKHKIFALLAVAGFVVVGYFWLHVPSVVVTQLQRDVAVTAVYASGSVEPSVMLRIAPKLTGRLAELVVDERAVVKAGQVLARLDDQELAASLAQLQARLDLAVQEAARAKALLARGSGTIQQRDQTASAEQEARAAVAMIAKQRSEYTLTAPADGTIIRRDGEVGELIPANQTVFSMACCAPLRITATVDEEDVPLVQAGQKVLVRADAFPGQVFTGSVTAITPKGDPTARNFRVRIALPETMPLLIGMTTEVNIVVEEKPDAWLLPVTAVRDGKVWLVRDGRLRLEAVTVGATNSGKIEVKSGLAPEAAVVAVFDDKFKDGQKRRAVPVAP